MSEIIKSQDLPTELASIPDRIHQMHEACPECGQQTIAAWYDASTGLHHDSFCISPDCEWAE